MISSRLQTLVEAAEAEAKRFGHERAGSLHLAAALANRSPDAFEGVFGEGSAKQVKSLLRRAKPPTDDPDVKSIAEGLKSDDPDAIASQIRAEFGWINEALDQSQKAEEAADGVAAPDEPASDSASEGGGPASTADGYSPPTAIRDFVDLVPPDDAISGREQITDELLALLTRCQPATALVSGQEGSGKTALLSALANRIDDKSYEGPLARRPIVRLRPEGILADNPVSALDRSLDALKNGEIVAIDDLETIAMITTGGAAIQNLARIRAAVEDSSTPLILLIDSRYEGRLRGAYEELVDELVVVPLEPIMGPGLEEIGERAGRELASYHDVQLSTEQLRLAGAPAGAGEMRAHPGLLVDRIDAACAKAAMRTSRSVIDADFSLADEVAPPSADALAKQLRDRVLGQDTALDRVAQRLALTRAEMDLRPARPDGVFLLVGPTGVGKTELARAVADALHGSEDTMIRLDMSEYAHDWAISRLTGPQPGYVGYTEPDGWLTTQVRKSPNAVILLDEIEKAHPAVWNAFLQVFDAGRLTDARGEVTDFSKTVVLMTSNIGAREFGGVPIGFGSTDGTAKVDSERVLEEVKAVMPPEFINRIDELVVFQPLGETTIRSIAELEIKRTLSNLDARGFSLRVGNDVVDLIATSGYDPAYGARHLQRNIERLLLQTLAAQSSRTLEASAVGGQVTWSPPERAELG